MFDNDSVYPKPKSKILDIVPEDELHRCMNTLSQIREHDPISFTHLLLNTVGGSLYKAETEDEPRYIFRIRARFDGQKIDGEHPPTMMIVAARDDLAEYLNEWIDQVKAVDDESEDGEACA